MADIRNQRLEDYVKELIFEEMKSEINSEESGYGKETPHKKKNKPQKKHNKISEA